MFDFNLRLENIEAILKDNPYRIEFLFEKALILINVNKEHEAKEVITTFTKLPGVDQHSKLLFSLIERRNKLQYKDNFWFIFPEDSSNKFCELIIRLAKLQSTNLKKLKGSTPDELILFEITPYATSLLDYSLPGVSYIRLSGLDGTLQKYSAAIAHELSHVFWMTKNRVISEGIALYYESALAPDAAFIGSYTEALEYLKNYDQVIPTIKTLLSNRFSEDVFFSRNTSSTKEQLLIYNLAFILMHKFINYSKNKNIELLISRIERSEDENAYDIFCSFFDNPIGNSFCELVEKTSTKHEAIDYKGIELDILKDRLSEKSSSFDLHYKMVAKVDESLTGCLKTTVIRIRLLLLKIYRQVNEKECIDQVALALTEDLIQSLSNSKFEKEAFYFLAKANIIRLLTTNDAVEKYKLLELINQFFEKSLDDHTLTTEAHIDYAKFKLSTPVEFGRDLNGIVKLVDDIELDKLYHGEIKNLKERITKNLQDSLCV